VFGVMDLHSLLVDVGFEGVVAVWKGREGEHGNLLRRNY
jgi:hypothetical protein